MFIEKDITKRVAKPRFFLAKPNQYVIAPISEAHGWEMTFKLGGINELSFSIPYYIEDNGKMKENPNIKNIKERMLIKVITVFGTEWFIVDKVSEEASQDESFRVDCFSLGYELRDKRVSAIQEESINAKDLLDKLLLGTNWKLNSISSEFLTMFRMFDESGTNVLDFVLKVAETYNALILFDTDKRELNVVDYDEYGSFKGLSVNYGNLMESVSVERISEQLVTRLYIEGSEGLTITEFNPTGLNYIEDFSYFMYPFERDEAGNITKSSHFMSDDLCVALETQSELIEQNSTAIKDLIADRAAKLTEVVNEESALEILRDELDTILTQLDFAQASGDTALVNQRKAERDSKQSEITAQEAVVAQTKGELDTIESDLDAIYTNIATESNLTQELLDELSHFIVEREWKDDRYIDAEELYTAGVEKFNEYRTPQITLSVELVNFLKIIEEEYYWDKLLIGDTIKVKHPRISLEFYARMTDISYSDDGISITISNITKTLDNMSPLAKSIKQSATASSVLENSKRKWNKSTEEVSLVAQLMDEDHDATKRKITAGADNLIEISNRGIIVQSPSIPMESIIIQSGVIALSDSGGENWNTAIKPSGIVADRLIGTLLAGENLLITNSSGSLTIDHNGMVVDMDEITIRSGTGGNAIDDWNTNIDNHNTLQSEFTVAKGQISMVVSETNEIKAVDIANAISITPDAISLISSEVTMDGDEIVSSINIQPDNIKIESKNLDLIGAVTFYSLDSTTQDRFTSAEDNAEKSSAFSGKILHKDATFQNGFNDVSAYNNSGGSGLDISRVTKPADAPTDSTHILEVTKTGTTSPAYGGFNFATQTRAGAVFVTRFIAKLPVGSSFTFSSNSVGDGGSYKWLSSTEGTGKYEEYVHKVVCGDSGTFSSTNYFYVNSSEPLPFTWQLAYATVYDATEVEETHRIVDEWAVPSGSVTKIDGGKILTNSVLAEHIKVGELVVGENVTMGAGATISWSQVTSQPAIPQTASDIGALPDDSERLTHITSTGVYTGTVSADNVVAGTITGVTFDAGNSGMTEDGYLGSSVKMWAGSSYNYRNSAPFRVLRDGTLYATNAFITGGQITGGTIAIETDARVGKHLELGDSAVWSDPASIRMPGFSVIVEGGDTEISTYGVVNFVTRMVDIQSVWEEFNVSNSDGTDNFFKVTTESTTTRTAIQSGDTRQLHLEGAKGHVDIFANASGYTLLRGYSSNGVTAGALLKFVGQRIDVRLSDDSAHAPIQASDFQQVSMRETKTDIKPYDEDALHHVRKTQIYDYLKIGENNPDRRSIGMMYDEAPNSLRADGSVNLYSSNMMLWRAVQQLSEQVDALKSKLDSR